MGETANKFKHDGSTRIAMNAMLPQNELANNFLHCLAEEPLILEHVASGKGDQDHEIRIHP
jgi:hypothetical protein